MSNIGTTKRSGHDHAIFFSQQPTLTIPQARVVWSHKTLAKTPSIRLFLWPCTCSFEVNTSGTFVIAFLVRRILGHGFLTEDFSRMNYCQCTLKESLAISINYWYIKMKRYI